MDKAKSAQSLHVVFFAAIPYPRGLASTNRVQHAIDGLRYHGVECSIVISRQDTSRNSPAGRFKGVEYETLVPDRLGWRVLAALPWLVSRSKMTLQRRIRIGVKNVLYVYGHPTLDNIFAVSFARKLGYSVIFDVVEDYDTAFGIDRGLKHWVNVLSALIMNKQIDRIADGIVVISSRLERKFRQNTKGNVPIHLRSISIVPEDYVEMRDGTVHPSLFYAGSFGTKDGIDELIAAFELVAANHPTIKLVMTGQGTQTRMEHLFRRIAASAFKDRISYLGYLSEADYYATLGSCSIACMTRIDSKYANAGFPFKLGEFLASGIPVVASDVSDVRSFFVGGEDIMLVRPGSVEAIRDAVSFLLAHPDKAKEMGERGRRKALNLLGYKQQAHALLSFLRQL